MPETKQFGSLEMVVLNKEHTRTYVFPDTKYTVHGITHLHVKKGPKGDSHRLRDVDGRMYYVKAGWIAIEFKGLEEWTL